MGMKKVDLKKMVSEAVTKKMTLDEESYFEGYEFVTNGHEMELFDSNSNEGELIKRSIVVKWKLKFDMSHIGIHGANVEIKSVAASIEKEGQPVPLNLNGFAHSVTLTKNAEVDQLQIFIKSIYIDVAARQILLDFTI